MACRYYAYPVGHTYKLSRSPPQMDRVQILVTEADISILIRFKLLTVAPHLQLFCLVWSEINLVQIFVLAAFNWI